MCESDKAACDNPWTFANVQYGVSFPFSQGDTRDAQLVDINEDGWVDAIIAFYGQATRVYINTQGLTMGGELLLESFERWPLTEPDTDLDELRPVDIDGDGDTDLIGRKNHNEIRLYMNDRFVVQYQQFNCDPMTEDCSCNPCRGDVCERIEFNGAGAFYEPDGRALAGRQR